MAHWQAVDGTRSSVLAINQLANILRRAMPRAPSVPGLDPRRWTGMPASALQGWFYATRWGRLPPTGSRARLRVMFRFARLALLARCHDGPWWELDDWHPRCDPRIPLTEREPQANYGCSPGQITPAAGCGRRSSGTWARRWRPGRCAGRRSARNGCQCLPRFDRWLADRSRRPAATSSATRPPRPAQAAAFRRWDADPANRLPRSNDRPLADRPVHPRLINDDLRAVAELFAFVAANPAEARQRARRRRRGTASPRRTRRAGSGRSPAIPHQRDLNDDHYVDDHALAPDPRRAAAARLAPRRSRCPSPAATAHRSPPTGFDDPQAMRMILLQILTGRRASEIRTCDFDCLSAGRPAPSTPPTASRSPGSATPKARSTSHPTPSSSTGKSPRSSRSSSAGSATQFPDHAAAVPVRPAHRQPHAATSPIPRAPTTGCCASSATWSQITDSQGPSRSGSATPTDSGTPG